MKTKPENEIIYTCPSNNVTVIKTNSKLKRFPAHSYKCVLFLLRPQQGTRVCMSDDGRVEFMFAWDEMRAALGAIDPKLAALLPKDLKNKPIERKQKFDAWNGRRARNKSKL